LLPKLLVILGPTATGKSDLAVFLAQKFNGEVVSADSRQVYRGMDIGTGKITKEEMRGVPHHLLDIVSPCEQFSVAEYQELAERAISDVHARKKLPILCGGTGQYIKAVINHDNLPDVPPNQELRAELETWDTGDLAAELDRLDARRAADIDRNNRRRLIRAIEIAKELGSVPPIMQSSTLRKVELCMIGLKLPAETLRERIHMRLLARLVAGMLDEVERLHVEGLSWERLESFGLEYRYCSHHLQGKIMSEQMVQKLETEIWRYAKRQMTWFKKFNPETRWFSPEERDEIAALVAGWLDGTHSKDLP